MATGTKQFHQPEPTDASEKAGVAAAAAGAKFPGKFHRAEIESLDNGYTVRVTRRSKTKKGKGEFGEDFDHHRTESAFQHKNHAVSHLMEHIGAEPDEDDK